MVTPDQFQTEQQATAQTKKRRWCSVSLRSMLLLMLLLGCSLMPLARYWHRYQRQRAIIEQIQMLGGRITYSIDLDSNAQQNPMAEEFFGSLDKVDLAGRVKADDLRFLSDLYGLDWLDASGTSVSDLRPLANMRRLRLLELRGAPVSQLGPLAKLGRLEKLDLMDTGVTDLRPLSELKRLQQLDLRGTAVEDLSPVASLPNLTIIVDDPGKLSIPAEMKGSVVTTHPNEAISLH